jgi:hypothetical protein
MTSEHIPEDLLKAVRSRSNRQEQSRFPHKLWQLLDWSKDNPDRCRLVGCGWTHNSEFFIEKSTLSETMKVEQNTLNVNLRHLGFHQSRAHQGTRSYWMNDGFCRNSRPDELERIRNDRCRPESIQKLDLRAVYLPILEPLQIWTMLPADVVQFKREVINEWYRLVGKKLVFGMSKTDFHAVLLNDFDELHGRQCPERLLLQQAFTGREREICDIFDFAVFLARFGPYRTVPDKLSQYQIIINELKPDYYSFAWQVPSFTSHFSQTFHNCIRFQLVPTGEYHCYNLPSSDSKSQFLIDEDGVTYQSWQTLVHQNQQFLSPQGH